MQKEDLKSLVTQMYDNLLENIDSQEEANKEQVVSYLRDSIDIFSHIDDSKVNSIEEAKAVFNNAYRELAAKGISSYKHTNKKFELISQMHEETINLYHNETIDIPSITEKFNSIQTDMIDEIQKANYIIEKLSTQIESLERDSKIDSLTKVFNRRALTAHLENICSHMNIPYEFHVLILDVDDFKIINETYGHIAGDKILIFIANILKKTLRDGDKIFRYGGEEFVLILNRIDLTHCEKIATRILELISKNTLLFKGQSINVTVSIGSTVLTKSDTPESLLERANTALDTAKSDGKNIVRMELADGN